MIDHQMGVDNYDKMINSNFKGMNCIWDFAFVHRLLARSDTWSPEITCKNMQKCSEKMSYQLYIKLDQRSMKHLLVTRNYLQKSATML